MKKLLNVLALTLAVTMILSSANNLRAIAEITAVLLPNDVFNEYAGSTDGKNNFELSYEDDGLVMETGIASEYTSYMTACSYLSFSVANGNSFELTITIPEYEEPYLNRFTDIIFVNQNEKYNDAQFRIWNDTLKGRFGLFDNYYWADETSNTVHQGSGLPNSELFKSEFLYRDETENGELRFKIKFDTTNFLQSVFSDGGEMRPIVTDADTAYAPFLSHLRDTFENTETVKVTVRMGGMGDTAGRVKVTFNEINGQSLANNKGYLIDTANPFVSDPIVVNKVIQSYADYNYVVRKTFHDPVSSNTFFYSDFANDIIAFRNLQYKINLKHPDGKVVTKDGLEFSTAESGEYKISVTVTDPSGNSYTSNETAFNAVDVFRLTFDGEFTVEGALNTQYKLPTVKAIDANGSEVDLSGNKYVVSMRITDPLGMPVTPTNNEFTLSKEGNYTIRYSASNPDTEEIAIKTVVVKSVAGSGKSGCSGQIKETVALSGLAFGCLFVVLSKKMRRNKL